MPLENCVSGNDDKKKSKKVYISCSLLNILYIFALSLRGMLFRIAIAGEGGA